MTSPTTSADNASSPSATSRSIFVSYAAPTPWISPRAWPPTSNSVPATGLDRTAPTSRRAALRGAHRAGSARDVSPRHDPPSQENRASARRGRLRSTRATMAATASTPGPSDTLLARRNWVDFTGLRGWPGRLLRYWPATARTTGAAAADRYRRGAVDFGRGCQVLGDFTGRAWLAAESSLAGDRQAAFVIMGSRVGQSASPPGQPTRPRCRVPSAPANSRLTSWTLDSSALPGGTLHAQLPGFWPGGSRRKRRGASQDVPTRFRDWSSNRPPCGASVRGLIVVDCTGRGGDPGRPMRVLECLSNRRRLPPWLRL